LRARACVCVRACVYVRVCVCVCVCVCSAQVQLTAGPHKGDEGEVVCIDRHGHFELRFMHRLKKRQVQRLPLHWMEDGFMLSPSELNLSGYYAV
jgi:hypothetical protein